MQNVKLEGGDNAIVGDVTQHASVVVSDQEPASAARAPKAVGARRARDPAEKRYELE
ncbi:hypothetical protein [Bradyrhizobium sp. USDA 4502]